MPRRSAVIEQEEIHDSGEHDLEVASSAMESDEVDWTAEAQSAREEQVALNLQALMALPEVEARILALAEKAAETKFAQAMGLNTPSKSMTSKIHDRFITEANGRGDVRRHFRCDNAMATKIIEIDMAKLRKVEAGEIDVPEGKSERQFCSKPGEFISFIDGHCYTYTDNQTEMILWLREQPPAKGGMPGIYEDHSQAESWACDICVPQRVLTDRKTWEDHRLRTHGISS
jgi:hypothetical protein